MQWKLVLFKTLENPQRKQFLSMLTEVFSHRTWNCRKPKTSQFWCYGHVIFCFSMAYSEHTQDSTTSSTRRSTWQCNCIQTKCSSLSYAVSLPCTRSQVPEIIPFPPSPVSHWSYKAALCPSLPCSPTNASSKLTAVELQATNQEQNTGRKEEKKKTNKPTIKLRFCFLISYFSEQIRHRGTKIERNVQTWEVQNSYRGAYTKGRARHRQGNCWFSSGNMSDQYSNTIMMQQISKVLHWHGETKCKTPPLVLYRIKMPQADRISHSESIDRTGWQCWSWILRARLWTGISAEQQRTTH